jgi:hypothetical protein
MGTFERDLRAIAASSPAGTADIVLPLLFPAEKTSFTALLAR